VRIVIVGAGVVGTATGKGFARRGHAVGFVDTDGERVESLRAEGLAASHDVDLRGPATLVLLSVPTPSGSGGYDLAPIRHAAAAVGDALRRADEPITVAVRSTVAPGTLEGTVQPIIEERSGLRAGEAFSLASNPEFLRAECALEDFLSPWMTVIGARSKRTRERLSALYRPFGGELRTFADPAEAELVKLVHNLYNAAKISFFNEVWTVATQLGLDADRVTATVARSAEASWNVDYGIRGGRPYAGACLPKDVAGFLAFARELGVAAPVSEATALVNERMHAIAAEFDGRSGMIDLRQPARPADERAGVPRR
jgi:UDPglucose 6-dehydrogenase